MNPSPLQLRQDSEARRAQTIRHVQIMRSLGSAGPRRKMPRARFPREIEQDYGTALVGIVNAARRAISGLMAELPRMAPRGDARADAGEARRVRELVHRAGQVFERAVDARHLEDLAKRYAERTSIWQHTELGRQVRAQLGVDVLGTVPASAEPTVEAFVGENVSLIKSVGTDELSEIERIVTREFANGARHETIAAMIAVRFEIGERRARRIARDQVGKLNGQLAASRQQALGVEHFVWRSVGDIRVRGTPGGPFAGARPSHFERNGKRYAYKAPPLGELPGMPILCRCSPEPDFADILAGL